MKMSWKQKSLLLSCGLLCLLAGCGGGTNGPQPTTSPVSVSGRWTFTKTRTAASHAACGAVGDVVVETWDVTQAAGSAVFTVSASVNVGGETLTYAATQLNNGTFTATEEKITSVANRCFAARNTALVGALNAAATSATGTVSTTLRTDPQNICAPLGQPDICTGSYTFTLQKQ